MIQPVANKYRSPLRELKPPKQWTSNQAKRLVEAIISGSHTTDLSAADSSTIFSIEVCRIGFEQRHQWTPGMIMEEINVAMAKLINAKGVVLAHGVSAFAPKIEPEIAPRAQPDDDQQTYMQHWIISIHKAGRRITTAGDRRVTFDESGTYVLEEPRDAG
jgi:hypothetical protein